MGSALMGPLRIFSCFYRGTFRAPIFQNLSISVNFAFLFPQPAKTHYFSSGPIRVDPICPQTKACPSPPWATTARARPCCTTWPSLHYNMLYYIILYYSILYYITLYHSISYRVLGGRPVPSTLFWPPWLREFPQSKAG